MMWAKEISEGAHVGSTTHQGTPRGAGVPSGLCPPGAPPSDVICIKNLKYSEKIILSFQGIVRTSIFGSFFIARENQKIDKMWHLFYLTNKNKE